jgi:hypothetical protein
MGQRVRCSKARGIGNVNEKIVGRKGESLIVLRTTQGRSEKAKQARVNHSLN